jgi:hypothetical protein
VYGEDEIQIEAKKVTHKARKAAERLRKQAEEEALKEKKRSVPWLALACFLTGPLVQWGAAAAAPDVPARASSGTEGSSRRVVCR